MEVKAKEDVINGLNCQKSDLNKKLSELTLKVESLTKQLEAVKEKSPTYKLATIEEKKNNLKKFQHLLERKSVDLTNKLTDL